MIFYLGFNLAAAGILVAGWTALLYSDHVRRWETLGVVALVMVAVGFILMAVGG